MGNSNGAMHKYTELAYEEERYQGGFIWDFVDQALYQAKDASKYGTDHVFAFGGDYNDYDPSDNSFCCNGVIAADRTLHPHAYEVAYQHRSIHTSAGDVLNGKVEVYNENFFINLSRYAVQWDVEVDGLKVLSGSMNMPAVAPQTTLSVDLGFDKSQIEDAAGKAVSEADIQANVEEVTNEPLIGTELKGAAVKKTSEGIHGSTVWTLKNGLKVVVLPTEYKKDQVLFNIELIGGKNAVATEDLVSFEDNIWTLFLQNSGISKFAGTQVPKMLAGKSLSVSPYISNIRHGVQGQCAPKDLETALQIAYLYFADPRFDQKEFDAGIQQLKAVLPNIANNPDFLFQQETNKIVYGNDPRVIEINEEVLEKADLATIEKVYRELFKDAAGAKMTIVGNVDPEAIKPFVEKYIGSIKKNKKAGKVNDDNVIRIAKGNVDKIVELEMATPKSTVLQVYTAYMPIDTKTEVALDAAKYVLDMIYTKTIREDEGGTYGVGVAMAGTREPEERAIIQVSFSTNPESAEKLSALAVKGLKELAENGPAEDQLNMAIENFKKNIPESRISNSYWAGAINSWYRFGIDSDAEYEEAVNSLTADDVKKVLQAVLAQNNVIEITSTPKK